MNPRLKTNRKTSLYFGLTFGWSILFWLLTIIFGGINQFPGSILFYVAGAGPVVAALIFVYFFAESDLKKSFWSRTFDFRRIPILWLLPSFLVHPLIIIAAFGADKLLSGQGQFEFSAVTGFQSFFLIVLSVFILGPLPEEMGWRGIAYEELGKSTKALPASIVLGTMWALWHVPLFFIEGTFHYGLGLGSARFWIFSLSNIPLTVIITWIYNHTDRSILSAAIIHFSGNIVGAFLPKTNQLALFELVGLIVVAIFLGLYLGPDLKRPDS